MKQEDILSFCSRCHQKFQEIGEVLEYGEFYPASRYKRIDGVEVFMPDTWEIKKALCKGCMITHNSIKFDEENKNRIKYPPR